MRLPDVPVGMLTGVGVANGVMVGDGVNVFVSVSVGVDVGVSVGVPLGVPVGVIVGVSVGVPVGVAVGVSVGVLVGVPVGVAVGVSVGVLVGVGVGVSVGVFVGVGVGVSVGVFVGVGVTVGVTCAKAIDAAKHAIRARRAADVLFFIGGLRPSGGVAAGRPRLGRRLSIISARPQDNPRSPDRSAPSLAIDAMATRPALLAPAPFRGRRADP